MCNNWTPPVTTPPVEPTPTYLTFQSPSSFTLNVYNNKQKTGTEHCITQQIPRIGVYGMVQVLCQVWTINCICEELAIHVLQAIRTLIVGC